MDIFQERRRAECGKFGKIAIEIHETPIAPLSDFRQTEKPTADNPVAGKSSSEKHAQYTNNQLNNNQVNNYPSINHSDESEGKKDTEQLRKFVAENIKLKQFYEVAEGNASEQEMIREIYDTICDIVCFPREQITIKGTSYPWQVVKSQFLKLKPVHIANLLERLVDNSLEIKNMEAYLISTLYAESLSGTLKEQADLHDDYLRYLRGNPYQNIQ